MNSLKRFEFKNAIGENTGFLIHGPFKKGKYSLNLTVYRNNDDNEFSIRLYYLISSHFHQEDDNFFTLKYESGKHHNKRKFNFILPANVQSLMLVPLSGKSNFEFTKFDLKRVIDLSGTFRIFSDTWRLLLKNPRTILGSLRCVIIENGGNPYLLASDNIIPLNFNILTASSGNKIQLNVLLPGIAIENLSGGPNSVINLTLRMARDGISVKYIATDADVESDNKLFIKHLKSLSGMTSIPGGVEAISASNRSLPTQISENDIFMGTSWWTVQMVRRILPVMKSKKFLYFIQDYEPGFYGWSTKYTSALNTYSLNFDAIINESLLKDYLVLQKAGNFGSEEFVKKCAVFEPAVDKNKFFADIDNRMNQRKRMLFYARPNAPRNLYELGILAIRKAAERGLIDPDLLEIYFMGENLPLTHLAGGVSIKPLPWLGYDNYAATLRQADIGLSLMLSPHTGYPTLEMAACGVKVITNTFSVKTTERLRSISSNIIPVDTSVESIIAGITQAISGADNISDRIAGSNINLPGNWDDVFNPLVPVVHKMIEHCLRERN